jgi:asparagine synthase (glutamine-hydrolysing)
VELAASLPESTKIKGGRLKHVMKEAMKDLLPADILNRKKRGFGTPMGAWMKSDLAPVVRSLLSPRSVDNRGLFRSDVVTRLIEDHQASRVDGTDRLLALLNLEIWSRIFLDRRTPADVTQELKALAA